MKLGHVLMKSLLIEGIKDISHLQEVRKKQMMILTLLPERCASVGITSPVTATTRSDVSLLRPHQMTPLSLPDSCRSAGAGVEHHSSTNTSEP